MINRNENSINECKYLQFYLQHEYLYKNYDSTSAYALLTFFKNLTVDQLKKEPDKTLWSSFYDSLDTEFVYKTEDDYRETYENLLNYFIQNEFVANISIEDFFKSKQNKFLSGTLPCIGLSGLDYLDCIDHIDTQLKLK